MFLSKQHAGSGTRRDQARQLVIDLESRGRQALPVFISCLEDTGQDALASFLRTGRREQAPEAIRVPPLVPLELGPLGLKAEKPMMGKRDLSAAVVTPPENLSPVVLGPKELCSAKLRPEVLRPVDSASGGFGDVWGEWWVGAWDCWCSWWAEGQNFPLLLSS